MQEIVKALGVGALLGAMQVARAATPLPAPTIDNERVTVWDIVLESGRNGPTIPSDRETVVVFLEGGSISTSYHGSRAVKHQRHFGDAAWVARGVGFQDTLLSAGSAHEIVIALKDGGLQTLANTSGYPAAFPRPGSVKVMETSRVIVWNYSWVPDVATPMHFHDKDVVVAYRYDGGLKSVTPQGQITVNDYKAGDIRFNKANRSHYEQLVGSRQSAVMLELK
jgi:hypothetical protein